MKRLMIMAAGTGGHIFPGLAIAQAMRERGWEVTWLGTEHGMERELVPKHDVPMDTIDFAGVRGKGLAHTLRGIVKLGTGFVRSLSLIGQRKPDVVLGMGGYVTVPGGLAAKLRGVPLVLMNSDAALLLSNKTLLPAASRVLFGFPTDFARSEPKARVTGNPVREAILAVPAPQDRYVYRAGRLSILVVGGSLGAKAINACLPAALATLPPAQRPHVTHQSGKKNLDELRAAYAAHDVDADVVDFIEDMPAQYAKADLVICRAGAITVAEINAVGVASVLIPLVVSTTSHQRDNAQWMQQQGAAIHLPQTEMNPQQMAALLQTMTREKCLEMAMAARELGQREANARIATILEELGAKQ